MQKITFIAQFPPPIHGLSKAVETLFNSGLNQRYHFYKINIADNKKILSTLYRILVNKSDLYYFTISQTKGGNWRDLLILKLLELKHVKCLIHLHGGYYRQLIDNDCSKFQKRLNYKSIRKLTGCIVLGKSLRKIFKGMIDDNRIFIVPNCVDNQYTLPESLFDIKMEHLLEDRTLNILYLSNFIPTKGYREVLQLACMFKENDINNFHFHFAGKFFDDNEKKYFENYIVKNGLEANITYHGIVTGETKNNLLRMSHIFILLTRYPNEGQPISILEAMGNAMLVITTNHAGIPDIVENGKNGLVVEKDNINVKNIFSYLMDIYANRKALEKICKTNYDIVVTKYTEQQYLENMDSVFKKVLSSGN